MAELTDRGFEEWLGGMRPRLHSFCGRMMGSAIDGEDVVQEALARAAIAYGHSTPITQPEAWLFRIARNAAIDALRQRKASNAEMGDEGEDPAADSAARAEVTLGFTAFLPLPPPQRASVVLIDVLGYSLAETATILETSVAAVKATLHRGRTRLASAPLQPAPIDEQEKLRLRAYADLFNARRFDALRDLLAADVQLLMPPGTRRTGKSDVSLYYTRYSEVPVLWKMEPAFVDGHPGLLATDPGNPESRFLVLLKWSDGRIVGIRDFFFARYVMDGIDIARI